MQKKSHVTQDETTQALKMFKLRGKTAKARAEIIEISTSVLSSYQHKFESFRFVHRLQINLIEDLIFAKKKVRFV